MPIRTRAHILEDESWNALRDAVSRTTWVLRRKESDYGIDGEIEIFDEKGVTTGLLFLFQLKATDQTDEELALSYRFLKKAINYYKKLELPVLLIRYVANSKALYYRWASSVDFYYSREDSKSIEVQFSKKAVWDIDTPNKLIGYLCAIKRFKQPPLKLPIEFVIEVIVDNWAGLPKGLVDSKIRRISEIYPEQISFVRGEDKEDILPHILPHIMVTDNQITVDILGLVSFTFHYDSTMLTGIDPYHKPSITGPADSPRKLNPYHCIVMGIVTCLSKLGHDHIVAEMAFNSIFLSGLLPDRNSTDFAMDLLFLFRRANRIDLAIKFSDKILDLYDGIFLQNYICSIAIAFFMYLVKWTNESEKKQFKEFCIKAINKFKDHQSFDSLGLLHYDLGYWIERNDRKNVVEAIHHYKMAAKANKDYRNRDYFYQRLGGCLFNHGKFKWSEQFYKRALDLGAPERCLALRADALMFAGEYSDSTTLFGEYLKSKKEPEPVWVLKKLVLDYIIQATGIAEQTRLSKLAEESCIAPDGPIPDGPFTEKMSMIERSLRHDALCKGTWFMRGRILICELNLEEGMKSMLTCALLWPRNITAWSMFLMLALPNDKYNKLFPCVIAHIYENNGEQFIEEFSRFVNKWLRDGNCPMSANSEIINAISKMMREYGRKRDLESGLRLHMGRYDNKKMITVRGLTLRGDIWEKLTSVSPALQAIFSSPPTEH
ncbi:MAG: DUF4365 domain-containing protein [Syntrophales bacterium]